MRPLPPSELFDIGVAQYDRFVPAPDLSEWLMDTFIAEAAELENEDHVHLRHANIGALWTNAANARQGRAVIGQAEPGAPRAMGRWAKGRAEQQVMEWFGRIPDFILTFSAQYAAEASDDEFCALVEHELYHCGQERDAFGAPKFRQSTGLPAFTMRGHDVEEFIGVVRRYGADASGVRDLVEAASHEPLIGRASIAQACGTCMLRAA
jgi:hypothetical protein